MIYDTEDVVSDDGMILRMIMMSMRSKIVRFILCHAGSLYILETSLLKHLILKHRKSAKLP